MKSKVAILHTNDLHSHLENFPAIKRFFQTQTAALSQQGYRVLRFDDGDAMDRFDPLTEATNGQGIVQWLNEMHYDAVTIGNNEALTNSHKQLDHLYDHANFPVILDNVLDSKTGQLPHWATTHRDFVLDNGTRLRLLGLTFPYPTFQAMGWTAESVFGTLDRCLQEWAGQYDQLILLSHLGINYDRELAKRYPELKVIIGGHTHHLLAHGEVVQQTLLTAAEKWGHYVGQITFEVDQAGLYQQQAQVFRSTDLPREAGDQAEVAAAEATGHRLLAAQKIARVPQRYQTSLTDDNPLVQLGLQAMMASTNAQAAVLNTGLFLHDLPAGIVNMDQLQQILPHNIHVMKTELWGYDLWRLFQEMEKNKNFLIRFPQKGMGFRGKYFGRLVYAGISYDTEKQQLYWHHELVVPEKRYTIALLDHYEFIPFFPTIGIVGKNQIDFNGNIRTVLAKYLSQEFPLGGGSHGTQSD
ncbi:5'-nucleotidase family protein in cluster with NagD-like phosphatase [Fructilactobacillus florum 8D]|uniref:5'-nucleotidase family protein in cluster with NagD-like phosphatase n=2 Tax=Fructilactobacillus florum TaxID=640331 RepID=W9EJS9_9LACO|nr:bifunctional metallophosphatase/5'-nucleotidase [Fructilactobacillus florum]ETO39924.1 5'-nucleotidase family protein in cluster with NagD-like phosphatase [Fructilactobacillus florum 8D]